MFPVLLVVFAFLLAPSLSLSLSLAFILLPVLLVVLALVFVLMFVLVLVFMLLLRPGGEKTIKNTTNSSFVSYVSFLPYCFTHTRLQTGLGNG